MQNKITRLEQELGQLNVQCKQTVQNSNHTYSPLTFGYIYACTFTVKTQHTDASQECDEYWVPPERLYMIDILFHIYT